MFRFHFAVQLSSGIRARRIRTGVVQIICRMQAGGLLTVARCIELRLLIPVLPDCDDAWVWYLNCKVKPRRIAGMGQLFKRRANAIADATVIGGALLLAGAGGGFYVFARSDYWTQVHEPQKQPVPFSHQHHVAGLGIDCRYCHTSVEKSAFAGIPPTETCMTCHSQVWKDAPVLQPLRNAWQLGAPLRWTRVHDLPDYVYFDHSIHVKKGIGCVTCHGRVDEMPMTTQVEPLYMRWCLDCHRAPEQHLRPQREVFNLQYLAPANQSVVGRNLIEQQHVRLDGLEDCYTCHR
jgi:hypothetical protein